MTNQGKRYGGLLKRWPERTLEQRFWEKVDKRGPDECWLWTASVTKCGGYGQFAISTGKPKRATRVVWELVHGAPPGPHMFVCHRCDTPRCVNPAHLFLGTQQDNNRDMFTKGRQYGNGIAPMQRLGDGDLHELRQAFLLGAKQVALARLYGLSPGYVHLLVSGQARVAT